MGSVIRILAVAILAPWLAVSAALAPEHVHQPGVTGHASVVHTHFEPHHHESARLDLDHHHAAELSAADEHVMWLDQVGIPLTAYLFPDFLGVVSTRAIISPQPVRYTAAAADEATLPHGPPRVSLSLRAPPSAFL